jgi:hypothetical protein
MSLVERISSQYFDTLSDDSMRQIFKKMETDPRKSVALASTCSRMRALGAEMRFPICLLLTAPSEEHLLPSFKFNVEYKARIFYAVEVHCKTTSLGAIRALHKATKDLANVRLKILDDDGDTDVTCDDLMSHLFQGIYDHLFLTGSDTVRLLNELNDAIGCEDKVAINAVEANLFDVGYDCDWDEKFGFSWAWGVGDNIYAGAEDQLEISFNLECWMDQKHCKLYLEVRRCSDREILDKSAYPLTQDETCWLRAALMLYRDVKKWENHPREPEDGSDQEEYDEGDEEA